MNIITKFVKTAGIYFFGNIITKIISFLLLPVYTDKIPPSDLGTFDFFSSLANLIIPLVFFQIWDGVFRFAFDYKNTEEKYNVIYNGSVIMLSGTIIFLVIYCTISIFYNYNNQFLVMLYSLSVGIQYFYSYVARSLGKNSLFVFSGCINSAIMLLTNIVLILWFDLGVKSLYFSSIIGVFVQVLIIELNVQLLRNRKYGQIRRENVVKLLKFSAPLSISTISHWLLTGLTSFVISVYIGTDANGLFSVANRFSSLMVLVVSVFQYAWNELAYVLSSFNNKNDYYEKGITEIFKITLLGCSALILMVKVVFPFFIAEQYNGAKTIIPIVLSGTGINAFSGFLGTVFLANKQSNKLFISTAIGALINIVGLIVLTPLFGLMGSLVALFLAHLISGITRLRLLRTGESVHIDRRLYILIILPFISIMAYYNIENNYIILAILFLLFIAAMIIMKPILTRIISNLRKA